jgi:predicted Fe-Mo cluster-binding NifX family protein
VKIAAVTDDGETISQHFGRARYYKVYVVDDGTITGREMRDKAGHHTATSTITTTNMDMDTDMSRDMVSVKGRPGGTRA